MLDYMASIVSTLEEGNVDLTDIVQIDGPEVLKIVDERKDQQFANNQTTGMTISVLGSVLRLVGCRLL